ncbi:MAG: hypothetical protein COA87_018180 [Halomonas sp.]|nr:hypothetical protein [Halomonas sp.]MBL1268428.1 hypothetical protein [Halomonas sp.]MBL1269639.1 hypothetical protein [Halomonas sp.]
MGQVECVLVFTALELECLLVARGIGGWSPPSRVPFGSFLAKRYATLGVARLLMWLDNRALKRPPTTPLMQ